MANGRKQNRTWTKAEKDDIFTVYDADRKAAKALAEKYRTTESAIRGIHRTVARSRARAAAMGVNAGDDSSRKTMDFDYALVRMSPIECLNDLLCVFTAKVKRSRGLQANRDTAALLQVLIDGIIRFEDRTVNVTTANSRMTKEALARLNPTEIEQFLESLRKLQGGQVILSAGEADDPVVYNPAAPTVSAEGEP